MFNEHDLLKVVCRYQRLCEVWADHVFLRFLQIRNFSRLPLSIIPTLLDGLECGACCYTVPFSPRLFTNNSVCREFPRMRLVTLMSHTSSARMPLLRAGWMRGRDGSVRAGLWPLDGAVFGPLQARCKIYLILVSPVSDLQTESRESPPYRHFTLSLMIVIYGSIIN